MEEAAKSLWPISGYVATLVTEFFDGLKLLHYIMSAAF